MPPAVRLGDKGTGHSCFPGRANDEGSSNVMINNLGAHTVGMHWVTHCCGPVCHDSTQGTGSPNVFVNGKPLARVGIV